MKYINVVIVILFFSLPLFSQNKPGSTHDNKPANRGTVNSTLRPEVADVIRKIDENMVRVDSGSFFMGCVNEKDSDCYYWEKPGHRVSVSTFYICKYAVTQSEWQAVVGDKPWFTKDCPECPVENISWFDVQIFTNKLNQLTGKYYRLPTEAEWEYAAKGGNKSLNYKYAGSNNPSIVAWYAENSGKISHPVGRKLPNELGLYDMSGNVWQWCADWFDDKYYSRNVIDNPTGPTNGQIHDFYRTCRGGSWWSEVGDLHISNRDRYPPDARDDDVGFRLARDL